MAKQTVLVTYEYDQFRTTSVVRSQLRQLGDVFSLDTPEDWPTEVWTAFERARADRINANIQHNTGRQDGGHALQHPSQRVVCKNEPFGNVYDHAERIVSEISEPDELVLTPSELLAEHSPLHFGDLGRFPVDPHVR